MALSLLRLALAYVVAVALAAALGSLVSAEFVLQGLAQAGARVDPTARLAAYSHDVFGLAPSYGGILAIAFLCAFPVAAFGGRLLNTPRALSFCLAGAAGTATALILAQTVVWGEQPISGARSAFGLAAQAGVGGLAGLLFSWITPPRRRADAKTS